MRSSFQSRFDFGLIRTCFCVGHHPGMHWCIWPTRLGRIEDFDEIQCRCCQCGQWTPKSSARIHKVQRRDSQTWFAGEPKSSPTNALFSRIVEQSNNIDSIWSIGTTIWSKRKCSFICPGWPDLENLLRLYYGTVPRFRSRPKLSYDQILGVLGNPEFDCMKLNERIGKIRVLFGNLNQLDDPQFALGILHHSIGGHKIVYALRCQTPISSVPSSGDLVSKIADESPKTCGVFQDLYSIVAQPDIPNFLQKTIQQALDMNIFVVPKRIQRLREIPPDFSHCLFDMLELDCLLRPFQLLGFIWHQMSLELV